MLGKHRVARRIGNRVVFRGIDYGAPITVVKETAERVLLRVKSSTQWSGTGQTDTVKALYILADKESENIWVFVEEQEPGKHWRKCLKEMGDKL